MNHNYLGGAGNDELLLVAKSADTLPFVASVMGVSAISYLLEMKALASIDLVLIKNT